jgi:hypothetical protein
METMSTVDAFLAARPRSEGPFLPEDSAGSYYGDY